MRSPNDKGSQFSKLHFPCNKEERLVLNSFFREYNFYLKKNNFKPVSGSLSSSQLFVTSPHTHTQITEAELNFCKKKREPLHLATSGFGNVKPTPIPEEGSKAHHKLTHRKTK